jgi:hypothetical protein
MPSLGERIGTAQHIWCAQQLRAAPSLSRTCSRQRLMLDFRSARCASLALLLVLRLDHSLAASQSLRH